MQNTLHYKHFVYHIDANSLTTGSNIVHLTPTEQTLTKHFFTHQNISFSMDFLMDLIDADETMLRKKMAKLKNIGFDVIKEEESYKIVLL